MNSQVCVDTNLVLKLVRPESDSFKAQALWESWASSGVEPIAPPLLAFEGTSVIRKWVHQGVLSPEEGELAFQAFFDLNVELLYPEGLHWRAWELARQFNRPQAYDSYYLALA
ncbi:MAG: type II toxin-antitoxin system VapC family toxin, partial [Anaerolineae bacterium]